MPKPKSQLTSENGLANLFPRKRTDTAFPKPKKVNCFQCSKEFFIKFVIAQKNYSRKNNWSYWTGEKKEKQICNQCLKNLYYDKPIYWKTITDLRKRNLLKSYLHDGHLT